MNRHTWTTTARFQTPDRQGHKKIESMEIRGGKDKLDCTIQSPTIESCGELQQAYDHFNKRLFDGLLPPCMITLRNEKLSLGYFSSERFANRGGRVTDEIAMNSTYFSVRSVKETLSTLVHEMVHLWQAHNGDPGRGRYHNKEWGNKMHTLGLMPSVTGAPGGKTTGEKMSHYIEDGGKFDRAADQLLTKNYTVSWFDRFVSQTVIKLKVEKKSKEDGELDDKESVLSSLITAVENKQTRVKYSCPECGANAWGKPGLYIICGDCSKDMDSEK